MTVIPLSQGGLALAMLLLTGPPSGVTVARQAVAQHQHAAQSGSHRARQVATTLTEPMIVGAFQAAGLPVDNLQQEPVYSPPGGPPLDATAVWRFSIPEVAPSGGKLMFFATIAARDQMVSWFRTVGTRFIVVHNNVILWLDPGLSSSRVAAYQQVLVGL
jgi:hypothetical protein